MIISALYARVSTQRQEKEATIKSQVAEIKDRIKLDGNILRDDLIFVDDGWSGSNLERPELDRMRDLATKKQFEALYIWDRDRISRSFVQQAIILLELEKLNIKVVDLHTSEPKNSEDKIMLGFKGLFAEYEREKIKERTRRGKIFKAKSGFIVHGPGPYGYKYIPKTINKQGHYVVDNYESSVVKQIFTWVADEGLSTRKVIKRLQELGIKPRKSVREVWNNSTLSRMLNNETYTGMTYYNKAYAVVPLRPIKIQKYKKITKTSRKNRDKSEWIGIKVPKIINKDLLNRTKEQLTKNSWFSDKCKKHDYLLSGLAYCSCGNRLVGEGVNGQRYYRCTDRLKQYPFAKKCNVGGVNTKRVDGVVWSKISKLLTTPDLILSQAKKWLSGRELTKSHSVTDYELKRLEKSLADLSTQEIRHAKAHATGFLSFNGFKDLMGELKLKSVVIQNQINKLKVEKQKEERVPKLSVDQLAKLAKEEIAVMVSQDRIQVLRKLVKRIGVDKDRISATIEGRIPIKVVKESKSYGLRSSSRDSGTAECGEVHII
ncbi:MAG: recombinase family protein [Candidatus Beckwithbacteria bacterium]